MKVRVPVATLPCTAAAYDSSIPKFKQFFFLVKLFCYHYEINENVQSKIKCTVESTALLAYV